MVKNLPANAGDMGSILSPGRSHKLWSKSPSTTTTEPVPESRGAAATEPTGRSY